MNTKDFGKKAQNSRKKSEVRLMMHSNLKEKMKSCKEKLLQQSKKYLLARATTINLFQILKK